MQADLFSVVQYWNISVWFSYMYPYACESPYRAWSLGIISSGCLPILHPTNQLWLDKHTHNNNNNSNKGSFPLLCSKEHRRHKHVFPQRVLQRWAVYHQRCRLSSLCKTHTQHAYVENPFGFWPQRLTDLVTSSELWRGTWGAKLHAPKVQLATEEAGVVWTECLFFKKVKGDSLGDLTKNFKLHISKKLPTTLLYLMNIICKPIAIADQGLFQFSNLCRHSSFIHKLIKKVFYFNTLITP